LRPLGKSLGVLAAALILIAAAALWQVDRFLNGALDVPEDGTNFEIAPGTPFARVSARLAEQGIVSQPTLLRIYARVSGKAGSIHAGEYFIAPGTTAAELLDDGQAATVLESACMDCHGLEQIAESSLDAVQWRSRLTKELSRGAALLIEDVEPLVQWLAE